MYQSFDEPSLINAIGLLRTPSQWPANFGPWNFQACGTCAMGLFNAKWNDGRRVTAEDTGSLIGISYKNAREIFTTADKPFHTVTPEDIATKLEELV